MDYCQRLASSDVVGCALPGLSSPSERGMSIAGPSDDSKTIPAERLMHAVVAERDPLGSMRLNETGGAKMILGQNIGIGPVIRVIRHFIERRRFCQLKFASGEQALVSVSGMPAPSIEFVRLGLGGLVPWKTVWAYDPIKAGGYSDYIHNFRAIFSAATDRFDDSIHDIRDALLSCPSIEDARMLLLQRERLANGSSNIASDFTRSRVRSAPSNDGWELGIRDVLRGFPETTPTSDVLDRTEEEQRNGNSEPAYAERLDRNQNPTLPHRYRIRQDGRTRVLTCVEAPTIMIRAERGLAITAKHARKYPKGTIFLDGAAQGDPFIDTHNELYNLDHHEGCIRSLATCEQAIVLIRKGLDLSRRDWCVLANDADVDTILAIWVLLNYRRLNDDSETRAAIMPLLRLAGVVDAHGRDAQDLAALPTDPLRHNAALLKQLQQQEAVLKDYGRWAEIDLLEYVADRLRAVDELIYAPETFAGLYEIDELARTQIAEGSVALACTSTADIDAVQRQLQKNYGPRLGILIFQDGASAYTVRRVDSSLPVTLQRVYERLNLLDSAVRTGAENRWSGSDEIGTSPRKHGTSLTAAQVTEAVREAFWEPTLVDVVSAIPRPFCITVAALIPALLLIFFSDLLRNRGLITGGSVLLSTVLLALTVGAFFWSKARQAPGLNGCRVPAGFGWLRTFPAALAGAAAGGVWAPGSIAYPVGSENLIQLSGAAALLPPLTAELLFRGVVLGYLGARLPLQKAGVPWWHSWPTLISSGLYAAASTVLFVSGSSSQIHFTQWFLVSGGSLIFGIASGIARERSESILPPIILHWVCTAALLLSARVLC